MTSSDPTQDAALAEALSQYAELLARHGVASPEAQTYYELSRQIPHFVELAGECRRLEEVVRVPRPGPASPSRNRGLLLAVAVVTIVVASNLCWWWLQETRIQEIARHAEEAASRFVRHAEQAELQAETAARLAGKERVRELVVLFNQATAEAQVPSDRWLSLLAAPGDLPREPADAGPETTDGAEAERCDAAEGVARAILNALKAKRGRLQELTQDPDEAVRARVQEVLRLLDGQRGRSF